MATGTPTTAMTWGEMEAELQHSRRALKKAQRDLTAAARHAQHARGMIEQLREDRASALADCVIWRDRAMRIRAVQT